LHKECPKKENTTSTPVCCNCQLARRRETASSQQPGLQACERGAAEEEITESTQTYNRKGVLLKRRYFTCLLRGNAPRRRITGTAASATPSTSSSSTRSEEVECPGLCSAAKNRTSVQASHVSSQPFENMLKVVTVVQQIMTEVSGALSQEEQIMAITKIVLKLMNQNGH
jgi:hypothetical protein